MRGVCCHVALAPLAGRRTRLERCKQRSRVAARALCCWVARVRRKQDRAGSDRGPPLPLLTLAFRALYCCVTNVK